MAKKKTTTTPTTPTPVAATPVAAPVLAVVPAPAVSPAPLPKPSFRDLDPVEQGGRTARAGFDFQDHVAAGKCLDMLLGGGPTEVWCEAEDDIVLVWHIQSVEWFEFVQVKSSDLGQAWTVAELCRPGPSRNGTGPGKCILEKSLAHDRGQEPCRFRVVTCWQPDTILAALKTEIDNPARSPSSADIAAVATAITTSFAKKPTAHLPVSPNGNGIAFWAERTVWECRATTPDVRNENLLKLERVLDTAGQYLAPDQRQELYDRLFRRVQDASLACGRTEKPAKRLVVTELRTWLLGQAHAILHPTQAGTSTALENKLVAAGVDTTSVEVAKEQRRRYLRDARQAKYLSVDDRDFVEGEILARLHRLKTRLDAGELADDGLQFHSRCQQEIMALRDTLSCDPKPPEGTLYGCMYDVMNRCLHRLVRASA